MIERYIYIYTCIFPNHLCICSQRRKVQRLSLQTFAWACGADLHGQCRQFWQDGDALRSWVFGRSHPALTNFCPCNRKLSASLYPCPEFPGGSFYLYMQHTETVEFNSSSATPIYLISVWLLDSQCHEINSLAIPLPRACVSLVAKTAR